MKVTSTMLLLSTDTPDRAMKPTPAEIENGRPRSHSACALYTILATSCIGMSAGIGPPCTAGDGPSRWAILRPPAHPVNEKKGRAHGMQRGWAFFGGSASGNRAIVSGAGGLASSKFRLRPTKGMPGFS
jgi:hypothetical protein